MADDDDPDDVETPSAFDKAKALRDDQAIVAKGVVETRAEKYRSISRGDKETTKRGCTPKTLALAGMAIAILIGAGVLLGVLNKDDDCDARRSDRIVLIAACANPDADGGDGQASSDGGTSTGGATGGGELTSLAGHYELASGLDHPEGLDAGWRVGPDSPATLSVGPHDASFDIADDGTVTGGSYSTQVTMTDPTCTSTITLESDAPSGSFQADGYGKIHWEGTQAIEQSCRDNGSTAWPFDLYFFVEDDTLVACRLLGADTFPTTTPTSCEGEGGEAARFTKS